MFVWEATNDETWPNLLTTLPREVAYTHLAARHDRRLRLHCWKAIAPSFSGHRGHVHGKSEWRQVLRPSNELVPAETASATVIYAAFEGPYALRIRDVIDTRLSSV